MSGLTCKVCDKGQLVQKRVHKMSGPVVWIGYILLVPTVLGVAIGMLVTLGGMAALLSKGSGGGAAVGSGVGLLIAAPSFVGGLLGWLLIMKKTILQCTACRATVQAS